MRKFIPTAAVLSVLFSCSGCGVGLYSGNALYPPASPTGLSVKELDESTVTVQWSDNADNESGYNIERSVNGGEFVLIMSTGPDETEFEENLPDDSYYSYRIHAFNSAGNSDVTGEISVKRPKAAKNDITVSAGGTINLAGLATIVFPPGSFTYDEQVAAVEGVMEDSVSAERQPYLDLVSDIKPVSIVDFTDKDLVLKKNIGLVMNYDPDFLTEINATIQKNNNELIYQGIITQADVDKKKISPGDLDIYFFNTISSKWVKTNAVIDTELHIFKTNVPYLGIYCIGYSRSVKTSFSLDEHPDFQKYMIETVNNSNQNIYNDGASSGKSSGTCHNSCRSSKSVSLKSISIDPYDGYHSSCTRCPDPLVLNGIEYHKIPGTDKNTKCDNCSSVGANFDAASGYAFTGACANHDCCYRYGVSTYGFIKEICDITLFSEMILGCSQKYPLFEKISIKILGVRFSVWYFAFWNAPLQLLCDGLASDVYAGIFSPVTYFAVVPYDLQPCFDYYNWGIDCGKPRLNALEASKLFCEPSETIDLKPVVYNPDQNAFACSWSSSTGRISDSSAANVTWTAPSSIDDDTEVSVTLSITDGINTIPSKTKTVTVLKPYTISYDSNNANAGTPPAPSVHNYYGNAYYADSNYGNLARSGYYFAGWNTLADGSGLDRPEFGFFVMEKGDITFYAKWLPAYKAIYNGNGNTGGDIPVDPGYYKPGTSVVVQNDVKPVKNGFSFAGWNSKEDGSGTDIGNYYVMHDSDITFYAKWVSAYTVEYNGNGNTGGDVPCDPGRYTRGSTVAVAGNSGSLVNSGKHFTGWNTEPDGSGKDRGAGGSFTMGSSNVILYAKWSGYPVTYNGNGSTGGSVPVDTTAYKEGDKVVVKNNTGNLVREGHAFNGWNVSSGGDGADYSAGSIFRLNKSNINLYARWSAKTYTVVFNSMGGTPAPVQLIDHGEKAVCPVSKKGGFELTGWTTDGTTLWNFNIYPVTGDIILYALWNRHIYNPPGNRSCGGSDLLR